jgi:hypothetical protein
MNLCAYRSTNIPSIKGRQHHVKKKKEGTAAAE